MSHTLRFLASLLVIAFGCASCTHERRQARLSAGPPLPAGRASQAGGNVGGSAIIVGGSNWNQDRTIKHWFADSLICKDGQWVPGPSLEHPVAEMAYASDGSALYLAGGTDGTHKLDRVYRFRSQDDRIVAENLPPLPVATSACAGALLGGTFYVASGYSSDGSMTDRFWALNVSKHDAKWTPCAPAPAPLRAYPTMVACDGRLYLLGGCAVENATTRPFREVFKTVHRYDPKSNAWARLPDLPTGGEGWVADAIDRQHLLVVGRGDTKPYDEVWEVDVRDLTTRGIASLPEPTFGGPLVRMGSGRWWFIGGELTAPKSRTPTVTVITVGD